VLAVMTASTQIGVPYRWGAVRPGNGFDCSGLILWAYRQHGINLPRTSRGMRVVTRRISQGELRPGDLVFYGRKRIHHVTMYIGEGMVIAAPRRGSRVQFQPLRLTGGVSFGRI
jgi:cell wall-associated NlpC family hydrolase